eukprot:1073208_1
MSTTSYIISEFIALSIIVTLVIPTLYFVLRKANQRRGYKPAFIIVVGFLLIMIHSIYQLMTRHSPFILRMLAAIGSILIIIGVAYNASFEIKIFLWIKDHASMYCPKCCKKRLLISDNVAPQIEMSSKTTTNVQS